MKFLFIVCSLLRIQKVGVLSREGEFEEFVSSILT